MIPVAPDNRPLNVFAAPPAVAQLEVPLAIRIIIAPFKPAARWVWDVVVLRVNEDGLALALLFSSALGIFPFWMTLALAVSGTVLISLSISNAHAHSSGLVADNRELRERNQALQTENHHLLNQRGELQIRYDDVLRQRTDWIREREHFSVERRDLIDSKTQIAIERNRLADEIRSLKQQENVSQENVEQLIEQKEAAEESKKQLEEQCRNMLAELGQLRAQLGQVNDYRKLHENLERFHDLYQQVVGGQEDQGGALQFAQERLIPQYKNHRAKLHEMLRTSMALLKDDDINLIPLNGILRLSEEEMHHVERISQTIHLLRELREPLANHFPQPINQAAGEI